MGGIINDTAKSDILRVKHVIYVVNSGLTRFAQLTTERSGLYTLEWAALPPQNCHFSWVYVRNGQNGSRDACCESSSERDLGTIRAIGRRELPELKVAH